MKSLLQTPEWVNLKVSQGWLSHEIEGIFVLEKSLPLGLSFLYAPEVTWEQVQCSQVIASVAKQSERSPRPAGARDDGVIFLRLEIIDENSAEIVKKLRENKLIKAFEELQPEWRQVIDISKSEDEILAQMKPKGRYNIKVAQKHGVEATVCPIDRLNDGVEIFYDLYQQTGQHQKLTLRDKKYFLEMMKVLYPKGEAAILIARYQNVPLSAIIVTFYDKTASYLYGGTSRLHTNVMAPYAVHYEAIKLAKEKGCKRYDLLAVAPPNETNHKYANLTFFKEQFGGRKVNIVGSYDLVYKPVWYRLFKFAEQIRR